MSDPTAGNADPPRWALETAANPTVLRLHVTAEITDETIVTCPPRHAPVPFDRVLGLEGVRSLDLHRHRVRLNLAPGLDRDLAYAGVGVILREAWGDAEALAIEELPRGFAVRRDGPRRVAESARMAAGDAMLTALFEVTGVVEAVAGDGVVLVRLGRLFRWAELEGPVAAAVS